MPADNNNHSSFSNNTNITSEEELSSSTANVSRPSLPKYATTHYGDTLKKFPAAATTAAAAALGGGFDKTLTVEKARFDTSNNTNIGTTSTSTATTATSSTVTTGNTTVATPTTVTAANYNNTSNHNIPFPPPSSTSTPTHPSQQRSLTDTLPSVTGGVVPNVAPPPLTSAITLPLVTTLQSLNNNYVNNSSSNSSSNPTTPTSTLSTALQAKSACKIAKNEVEQQRRNTMKRKKIPPLNGTTATPSEVFHRNLVDAVSNVEDSDENEQYVYPYSGGNNTDTTVYHMNSTDTLYRTTSSLYRPQSTRSLLTSNNTTSDTLLTPAATNTTLTNYYNNNSNNNGYSGNGNKGGRLTPTGFFNTLLRPILTKCRSESSSPVPPLLTPTSGHLPPITPTNDDYGLPSSNSRPKLRSYIMDHPFSQLKLFHHAHEWFEGGGAGNGKHSSQLFQSLNQQQQQQQQQQQPQKNGYRRFFSNYGGVHDGGYITDDEEATAAAVVAGTAMPHHPPRRSFRHKQLQHLQHQNQQRKLNSCTRWFRNICISFVSILIFLCLFMTYISQPLKEVTVDMGRVLSSDKELIFDLHVNAINTNMWTVHIADADISVFAFSQVVPDNDNNNEEHEGPVLIKDNSSSPVDQGVDPAEYLGGFYHFDEPLSFASSFFSKKMVTATSQIRIKSPGADKSGNERWSRIIRYPYGLVVRGVLNYKPFLSFLSPYSHQSVTICDVVRVNPITGKVSEDPDQGFCLTTTATAVRY